MLNVVVGVCSCLCHFGSYNLDVYRGRDPLMIVLYLYGIYKICPTVLVFALW